MTRDWYAWHHHYEDPDSSLSRRLTEVRRRIGTALDEAPAGSLRAVSLCAGQGRDLIPVLATHPRGGDVTALLVEQEPRNVELARAAVRQAGLSRVEVSCGDAADSDAYVGMVPADLVLACGIFGNISDADVRAVVGHCAWLCATGGTVVWTRGRWEPDLVPTICDWFVAEGFEQVSVSTPAEGVGVGAHRLLGPPRQRPAGATMFEFVGRPEAAGH
ncbi:class I SAM-dependent methyltransferase [Micromonospora palythoicola]|uniref:class I SAM-dependent methyltransferase n=1 Tax=Micromonospora palythoicola TaxID=3120507 RepID=UPI002FCE4E50